MANTASTDDLHGYLERPNGFTLTVKLTPDEYWKLTDALFPFVEDGVPLEYMVKRPEEGGDQFVLAGVDADGPRAFEVRDAVLKVIAEINEVDAYVSPSTGEEKTVEYFRQS